VGIGAGWHEEEHRAFGLDLPPARERWERLEETCAILDGLMTQQVFSFSGKHHRLQEAEAGLTPVQKPRPPIVIGGTGPRRTLPLVARWADHWNYYQRPLSLEGFRAGYGRLVELCAEIGRDPGDIEVSVQMLYPGDPARVGDLAAPYLEAGAHQILMSFPTPVEPGAVEAAGSALAALR
jgi:alkanesulfonate monooxygenase SsuD/methylene tetrahydromethanopterin reductase-like flavin-dependent oxidoreductase (luciferase family)